MAVGRTVVFADVGGEGLCSSFCSLLAVSWSCESLAGQEGGGGSPRAVTAGQLVSLQHKQTKSKRQ